jgi:mycothiol system anti-sigma-R factor
MADGEPTDDEATIDCRAVVEELYTFLDGELTVEKREHIRHHLDDCNPCLGAFDFEAELRIVISAKCKEPVPESLKQKVLRALEEA